MGIVQALVPTVLPGDHCSSALLASQYAQAVPLKDCVSLLLPGEHLLKVLLALKSS